MLALVPTSTASKRERESMTTELPPPGSPEASALIDSMLAKYGWPANPKNAARAGYEAARAALAAKPPYSGDDAATALEAQAARIAELEAALFPFVQCHPSGAQFLDMRVPTSAIEAARAALAKQEKKMTPELPPLLPCPFCGSATAPRIWTNEEAAGELWDESQSLNYQVVCDASSPNWRGGCGAAGGFMATIGEAIAVWQARADLAKQP